MDAEAESLDATLRDEADALLTSGLRDVLASYGEVRVVGSYALHLMAWRDVDIELVRDDLDRRAFFDLGGRIAEALLPMRMQYRDEISARTHGLPRGLYWGVYFGDERRGAWKIDVWAVPREHAARTDATNAAFAARLTPEARRAIIRIKAAIWNDPGYRRAFHGQDIYDAVMNHGVTDVDAFRALVRARSDGG